MNALNPGLTPWALLPPAPSGLKYLIWRHYEVIVGTLNQAPFARVPEIARLPHAGRFAAGTGLPISSMQKTNTAETLKKLLGIPWRIYDLCGLTWIHCLCH